MKSSAPRWRASGTLRAALNFWSLEPPRATGLGKDKRESRQGIVLQGCTGKIARVDLTAEKVRCEYLDEDKNMINI